MSLSHTILAMLNGKSRSGYDLQKSLDRSRSCYWQATMQQIYRELSMLEGQGLIIPKAISQTGRPDKKIYSVTPEGLSFLQEWVTKPSKPTPVREDLLVKTWAGHLAEPNTLSSELKQQQQFHQDQLSTYQRLWQDSGCHKLSRLPLPEQCKCMTLRRGIYHEQSWVDWCEETITWAEEKMK